MYPGRHEELYFQAAPPDQIRFEEDVRRPPMSCLTEHIPGVPDITLGLSVS